MKQRVVWLITLSVLMALILTITVTIAFRVMMSNQMVEFELNFSHLILLFFLILAIISLAIFSVFYKPVLEMTKLVSENVFSDFNYQKHKRFNPFETLKEIIKHNNEKSRAEIEKLNTLEKYRREYIGNVSHELKTPIFNIQGYISTLIDGGLEDEKVNRTFLEKAEKNVDRMINIVMDLQTISRFEAGELELNKEVFEIYQLIDDVLETEKEHAAKNQVFFELHKGNSINVFADKYRIRQVLTNLMVNSIKYCKPGGGKTEVRLYDLDQSVSIEISDNGIGMDAKHLKRIFERFYRVDSSRSREKGGSGLGLAIVKHIIEAHGESIEVLSTAGVGTVFRFTLAKPSQD